MDQKKNTLPVAHQYSIEQLYHFRCGACAQWWSIADFQIVEQKKLYCPKCGHKAPVESIKK
ncbi:hypothetical protein PEPS_02540 [Persicobacter psychrovividus]|uniref:Zinc ribbon domain-containing protein n=1 Tax=Persicobacter psychrovividus TaxID=387638 RepID=A0ABN6L9I0_9BACT|nr:hypothetical protein PEPS_02540 [Persicobacter psychrovividus]